MPATPAPQQERRSVRTIMLACVVVGLTAVAVGARAGLSGVASLAALALAVGVPVVAIVLAVRSRRRAEPHRPDPGTGDLRDAVDAEVHTHLPSAAEQHVRVLEQALQEQVAELEETRAAQRREVDAARQRELDRSRLAVGAVLREAGPLAPDAAAARVDAALRRLSVSTPAFAPVELPASVPAAATAQWSAVLPPGRWAPHALASTGPVSPAAPEPEPEVVLPVPPPRTPPATTSRHRGLRHHARRRRTPA